MAPQIRAGIVLLCVFAVGVVSGVALERYGSMLSPSSPTASEEHEAALTELREAVGLDDGQLAQVHAILADRQEIVQQMWEQLRPEVQAAMSQVHMEIAEVLRPDQRERFHHWLTERREPMRSIHVTPRQP